MQHKIDNLFIEICKEIISENKSPEEWAEVESDDWFQTEKYCGGFDATEMEFCFSLYENEDEYWFQVSLDDVKDIISGNKDSVEVTCCWGEKGKEIDTNSLSKTTKRITASLLTLICLIALALIPGSNWSIVFYLFSPLFILITLFIHLCLFGRSYFTLTLLLLCIIWGFLHIINPLFVCFVPNGWSDSTHYAIFRSSIVSSYLFIAIFAIIKKNRKIQVFSHIALIIIYIDLCGSHIDGRYVGP